MKLFYKYILISAFVTGLFSASVTQDERNAVLFNFIESFEYSESYSVNYIEDVQYMGISVFSLVHLEPTGFIII